MGLCCFFSFNGKNENKEKKGVRKGVTMEKEKWKLWKNENKEKKGRRKGETMEKENKEKGKLWKNENKEKKGKLWKKKGVTY